MPSPDTVRKRWLRAALFVGAWTALTLLAGAEMYVTQLLWAKPVAWELALRRAAKEIYPYAVLSLGILWLCRRVPFQPGQRGHWFLVHMLAAVLFSVGHVVVVSWLESGEVSVLTGEVLTFPFLFEKLLMHYTISNLFKYWIFVLGYEGWRFYRGYQERERQATALAAELVQARLQALRMQINPHFLFNTLNTISALVHEKPEAAERMIARLGELLRRTLDRGDMQEVPLREEIEFLRGYLEIEQMRFPDRLRVAFAIQPGALDLLVPHLLLQPLVENALRHGILPRVEPGRVEISAHLEGDFLELAVHDNGIGLPATNGDSTRDGIGLKNVRSRLLHLYGDTHRFQIHNSPAGGVEARVRIPCYTLPRDPSSKVVVMSASQATGAGMRVPTMTAPRPIGCEP